MQFHRLVGAIAAAVLVTSLVVADSAVATSRPRSPTALVGVEVGPTDFALTWAQLVDASGDAILEFRVYRSDDGVNFDLLAATPATAFVDSTYVEGRVVAYAVTAYSERDGESDPAVLEVFHGPGSCVKVHRFTIAIYARTCIGQG